jgi:hypothetical protein
MSLIRGLLDRVVPLATLAVVAMTGIVIASDSEAIQEAAH